MSFLDFFLSIFLFLFFLIVFFIYRLFSSPPLSYSKGPTPASIHYYRHRIYWITGATSGIGKEIAFILAGLGAQIIISARNKNDLEVIEKEIDQKYNNKNNNNNTPYYRPILIPLDLSLLSSDYSLSEKIVSSVLSKINNKRIDGLINNAGISMRGGVKETVLDVDHHIMNVNYFGTISLTKALLSHLLLTTSSSDRSTIGIISSVQGVLSVPLRSAYSASKHALYAFFQSLYYEEKYNNIDIKLFSPGYVSTNLSKNALNSKGKQWGRLDDNTAKGMNPHTVALIIINELSNKSNRNYHIIIDGLKTKVAIALRGIAEGFIEKFMIKKMIQEKNAFMKSD